MVPNENPITNKQVLDHSCAAFGGVAVTASQVETRPKPRDSPLVRHSVRVTDLLVPVSLLSLFKHAPLPVSCSLDTHKVQVTSDRPLLVRGTTGSCLVEHPTVCPFGGLCNTSVRQPCLPREAERFHDCVDTSPRLYPLDHATANDTYTCSKMGGPLAQ